MSTTPVVNRNGTEPGLATKARALAITGATQVTFPDAVLDYTPGSALNPLANPLDALSIDAPNDQLTETSLGVQTSFTISDRLGRPYGPNEALAVIQPPSGTLTLSGGDDWVLGLPFDVTLDGGGGIDTVRILANTTFSAFMGLQVVSNVERYEFDPAAQASDVTEALVSAALGVMPIDTVIGSPGADHLRIDVLALLGEDAVLDLRTMVFDSWEGGPGYDQLVVNALPATGRVEVHAHPDVPMRYYGLGQVTVFGSHLADQMTGGDGADHFEGDAGDDFFSAGPGADHVDGGPGRDMASWAGMYASVQRPAPVFVDLADGLPERGSTAEGDVLISIEDLWGSPDDDELRGDAQDNDIDGWDGNDLIEGRAGADRLSGADGNDVLAGGADDDRLVGGPGTDTGVWSGRRADFAATLNGSNPGSVRLVDLRSGSPEGTDVTFDLELFRFTDGTFTLQQLLSPSRTTVTLAGAAEVPEGQPWALAIALQPSGLDASAFEFRIDWGDGSGLQTLTGAALAARGGVVSHTFADDANGPVDRSAMAVNVSVFDPATQQTVTGATQVDVLDVAPVISPFGFGVTFVEHGESAVLTLGAVVDVGGDAVQQLDIDWGDGTSTTVLPGVPATHRWGSLGGYEVQAQVTNDDGRFIAAQTGVLVAATAGHAAPNGTAAQWAQAWTDSLMALAHRASPAQAWTPVTLTAVNAGVLAGGDLYGGAIGVSGRSANTSTVRQEIDGSEQLRIELAAGEHANAAVIDLSRLFTDDAPGLHEAGIVRLFDGATEVFAQTFSASQADGRLHLELIQVPLFTTLLFEAGAINENAGGVFRPGGMVDGNGGYATAPAGAGSDFLLEAVRFVQMVGVASTTAGQVEPGMGG